MTEIAFPADPIEAFTARAERAAAKVYRFPGLPAVATMVSDLARGETVAVSPSLAARYPQLVEELASSGSLIVPATPEEAATAVVGVTVGEAIVVETGSVLVSEFDLADRLVSMLSPVLVQVVRSSAVMHTCDEVAAELSRRVGGGRGGYHALITGPSRSADIERSLTIGVQGPAELHVALLEDA